MRPGLRHLAAESILIELVVTLCSYSSIAANMGICPSRRDDMESLGYVLVYFLRGSLPWQGLRAKKSEKNERVLEKKMEVPVETLCEDLPQEFAESVFHIFLHQSTMLSGVHVCWRTQLSDVLPETQVRRKAELRGLAKEVS